MKKQVVKIGEDRLTYLNVSNLDSKAIDIACDHSDKLLEAINRKTSGVEGTRNTISFIFDELLTEEEMDLLMNSFHNECIFTF